MRRWGWEWGWGGEDDINKHSTRLGYADST